MSSLEIKSAMLQEKTLSTFDCSFSGNHKSYLVYFDTHLSASFLLMTDVTFAIDNIRIS